MSRSDTAVAILPLVVELERLGVPYYLGGSVASSAFGLPRSTIDADLVADLAPKHVAPLVEALRDIYYVNAQTVSDAIARKSAFNAIYLATSFKVDVFPVKNRPYDRIALQRIRQKSIDQDDPSLPFCFASPEDIVLSKLEWFRLGNEISERQWLDVIGVLKVQGNALDRDYLDKWAGELGIADLLDRARKQSEI